MRTFPRPLTASINNHTNTESMKQIYRHPGLWRREVISQRPRPSPLTQVTKLAAIIVVLGFVFWLWLGISTYHAPLARYPYYDTQKPVPPWSEPMPLKGNYGRGEEHR